MADGTRFINKVANDHAELGLNVVTAGGYGGVQRGVREGRVHDLSSVAEAYNQGNANALTLGSVDGYVDARAGQGKGRVASVASGALAAAKNAVPWEEGKTLVDPNASGYEKLQALEAGTLKVLALVGGARWAREKLQGPVAAEASTPPGDVAGETKISSAAGRAEPEAGCAAGNCELQRGGTRVGCFVRGTLVHTRDGLKPIEEVTIADRVLAQDVTTGKVDLKPVLVAYVRYSDIVLDVRIAGDEEPLGVTPEHPFWTRRARDATSDGDADPEWVDAGKLRPGDLVLRATGEWTPVLEIRRRPAGDVVFNFKVDEFHTYYVGPVGTLVHNNDACPAGGKGAAPSADPTKQQAAPNDPETPSGATWRRSNTVGGTPGKPSRTGREVIARMRAAGTIIDDPVKGTLYKASDDQWYPLKTADMSHLTDAVTWWNKAGRHFGAKAAEVRAWMLDSANYVLDHFSINRSQGAKLGNSGVTYQPPASPPPGPPPTP